MTAGDRLEQHWASRRGQAPGQKPEEQASKASGLESPTRALEPQHPLRAKIQASLSTAWQLKLCFLFFQFLLIHGHHQMVNTEIRLIIFFAAKDGEALYSQQNQD